MTRGTAYLFLGGNVVYSSIEFNGDMYFYGCGYGSEMMEAIKYCDDWEGFAGRIEEFNESHHKYEEDVLVCQVDQYLNCVEVGEDCITVDLKKDYFNNFFSDYIFIKNADVKNIVFLTRDKLKVVLMPGEVTAFNFGYLVEDNYVKYRLMD
ncbi:hypothetical protein [Phascolarctobacterium sp.]